MKRLLAISILLAAAFTSALGQNNPYEIDDGCYEYFRMAEALVGDTSSEAFEYANAALLKKAIETGDEKARTLHYVGKQKRATRLARNMENREAANDLVDRQRKETTAIARETGYMQYYYYAYVLCQTYYVNTKQEIKAQTLLQEMMETATREGDPYGVWQSHSYLAALYQRQNDIFNARRHLQHAVEIYESTEDKTIRRQSISRHYCDLADTYKNGSDSARYYYAMAEKEAKTHLDTVRFMYYKAQTAALDHQVGAYRRYRDFCLGDGAFPSMVTGGEHLFAGADAILQGAPKDSIIALATRTNVRKQRIYLRELAIAWDREDIAAWLGSNIIVTFYSDIRLLNDLKMGELTTAIEHRQLTIGMEKLRRTNLLLWIALGITGAALLALLAALLLRNRKKTHTK